MSLHKEKNPNLETKLYISTVEKPDLHSITVHPNPLERKIFNSTSQTINIINAPDGSTIYKEGESDNYSEYICGCGCACCCGCGHDF